MNKKYLVKLLGSVTRDVFFGQPYYIHFYHKHPPHQYTLVSFFYYPYQLSPFSLLLQSKSFISSSPSNQFFPYLLAIIVWCLLVITIFFFILSKLFLIVCGWVFVYKMMWAKMMLEEQKGEELCSFVSFCGFAGYNLQTAVRFH